MTTASIKKSNGLKKNSVNRGQVLKIESYQKVKVPRKVENDEDAVNEEVADNSATDDVAADDAAAKDSAPVEHKKATVAEKKGTKATSATASKKKTKEKTAAKDSASKKTAKNKSHKVRSGESLSSIASKYPGVSVKDIQRANNLKGSKIQAGQTLVIPTK